MRALPIVRRGRTHDALSGEVRTADRSRATAAHAREKARAPATVAPKCAGEFRAGQTNRSRAVSRPTAHAPRSIGLPFSLTLPLPAPKLSPPSFGKLRASFPTWPKLLRPSPHFSAHIYTYIYPFPPSRARSRQISLSLPLDNCTVLCSLSEDLVESRLNLALRLFERTRGAESPKVTAKEGRRKK